MTTFDRNEFPESVSCDALPELTEGVVQVELADWEDNRALIDVPAEALRRLNMPRISPSAPEIVREPFERGIGMGLLACRIINQEDELASIEVPTLGDPYQVIVKATRIARSI